MHRYDKDEVVELSWEHVNVIHESKVHVLPILIIQNAFVDIYLSHRKQVTIESALHPIRHGRHCGSRVILSANFGNIDYNPKFIWNGQEWFLNTYGTFVFAEIEVNAKNIG